MATRRLYFDLVKSFSVNNITSIFGEMYLLEKLGFTFSNKEELKDSIVSARTNSSGVTFIEETKSFSEKATRNLLNECGRLIFKTKHMALEILPARPIGCYILKKITSKAVEYELYSNPFQMFENIRSIEGFNFDITLIQKHISKAVSENSVIDFSVCLKEFEYAKLVCESLVPFEFGLRFCSANDVLGKEIEIAVRDGNNKVEFFTLHYLGHIDMYVASMLVKNTPENLAIVKKLISKFGWQENTHMWFTEPLEEVLEKLDF